MMMVLIKQSMGEYNIKNDAKFTIKYEKNRHILVMALHQLWWSKSANFSPLETQKKRN